MSTSTTSRSTTSRPRTAAKSARRFPAMRGAALTPDGHRLLAERAGHLRERTLPTLRPLLVEWERDERDVAEFERVQAELDRLERLLAEAEVMDHSLVESRGHDAGRVRVGARIVIETPDLERETVRIVHPAEAFLDDERISVTSPLARALLGARVGETVWVAAPIGAWPARVVDVLLDWGADVPADSRAAGPGLEVAGV